MELEENDRSVLVRCLQNLAEERGLALDKIPEPEGFEPLTRVNISNYVEKAWVERSPEVSSGGPVGSMGMMVVRRRRQLVYSIKFSNMLRDPIISAGSLSLSLFAAYYTPQVLQNIPQTFPGFLIGLTFTVLRSIAHPVGYGEAALLHKMNQLAETRKVITWDDLNGVGLELVDKYDYKKGNNSNEVQALIQSLISWGALSETEKGFIVKESVPYGLGPLEYVLD